MLRIKSEYINLDKYQDNVGDIFYCKKDTDIIHNPYGPAIIDKSGNIKYYINGLCHRLDGPAIIYQDGRTEYWMNNDFITKEKFEIERLKFLGK